MLDTAFEILRRIERRGYTAHIVGGTVRDILLGLDPHDVDIATNCPILELEKMYPSFDFGKNKNFGCIGVRNNGYNFEIVQYRQDGEYSDSRHPDSITVVNNFKTDASRRDFTINAMGMDSSGTILDYFDGREDLKRGIIRAVGNAFERFQEDALRILRAVRFAARFGFEIDSETETAILSFGDKLTTLTPDRVKIELTKMASRRGFKFAKAIELMEEFGLLDYILPEVKELNNFEHTESHHPEGNVFDHTLAALSINQERDPILNLSILFHDLGKTKTYVWDNDKKKHTYHGHDKIGCKIVEEICDRLRFSNAEKDALMFVVKNHMTMNRLHEMKPSKVVKLMSNSNFGLLTQASYCDTASRLHVFRPDEWDQVKKTITRVETEWSNHLIQKAKIVDGNHVMTLTGLSSGKILGDLIREVTTWILDFSITDQDLIDQKILELYQHL